METRIVRNQMIQSSNIKANNFSIWIFIFLPLLTFSFCRNDKAEQLTPAPKKLCDSLTPTYTNEIAPIFNGNCALSGCHDAATASHEISLATYEQVRHNVQNSPVLCAIKWEAGCLKMPKDRDQLPLDKIQLIECWRENGLPK